MLSLPLPPETLESLAALGATRSEPLAEGELIALVTKHGYVAHASVLAFERDFGGLTWRDRDEPEGWLIGAGACVSSSSGHQRPRGGDDPSFATTFALVPIAYGPSDWIAYLDADGVVWAQDSIEGVTARPVADAPAVLFAGVVMRRRPAAGEKTKRARAALQAWTKDQQKRDAAHRKELAKQGFPKIKEPRELWPKRDEPTVGGFHTIAKPDPKTLIERARAADHARVFGVEVTPTLLAPNHLVIERGADRVEILTAFFGPKLSYLSVSAWGKLDQASILKVYRPLSELGSGNEG